MRIALISDIHEDYVSLKQATKLIHKKQCDAIACLGDIVGFGVPYNDYLDTRNANACIRWVKDNCSYVVAGNHDLFAIRRPPLATAGEFEVPPDWYQMSFQKRQERSKGVIWLYENNELSALLGEEEAEFLHYLPEWLTTTIDSTNVLFTHYIQPDITGSAKNFLFDYRDLLPHIQWMLDQNVKLAFSGHMHSDGVRSLFGHDLQLTPFDKKIKPASIDWFGLPAISSSKSLSGFCIWDTIEGTIETISLRKKFTIL
jgi:predicted phosphodiesterase